MPPGLEIFENIDPNRADLELFWIKKKIIIQKKYCNLKKKIIVIKKSKFDAISIHEGIGVFTQRNKKGGTFYPPPIP